MSYQEEMEQLSRLRQQVSSISNIVMSREKNLKMLESNLNQGIVPVENARTLERNMANNMGPLAPGNLGDINKVAWPFFFNTEIPADGGIVAGETLQTSFSVTQEAAFIFMSMAKTVYDTSVVPWNYLDPNQDGLVGMAPGLSFTLRDSSSQRQFFGTEPILLGNVGNPRFPTKLPRPIMLLPNQMMEVSFINTHAANEYLPVLTFFGYRIRIEDAQFFLSLVHG